MLTMFMAIAVAYFFGLGLIGFIFILGLLQIKREHGKLSSPIVTILTGFHFCLTIGGIFVAAILYRKYDVDMNDGVRFAFVITGFVMLGLLFIVAREWNQLLQKQKEK